ncbi:MAG: transcriptional regulator [Oscillospiraceae bacterium]|nr:transcriptional regulator [Oscillospiraceae bacterium]
MEKRYETFTILINRISRSIRRIKNNEMAEYGLRSVHISCLYYLFLSDGLTATELCERCEEDKATISRALDFLERHGYITCQSSSVKRYRAPLHLTDTGRQAGQQITDKIDRVLERISDSLCETDREIFYRSLNRISESLDSMVCGIDP